MYVLYVSCIMYNPESHGGTQLADAIDISKVRHGLSEIANRVVYRHERVVLRRHGKRLLAMVPLDDLAVLEAIEDRRDMEAAQKALGKPGRRNWQDLKKDLDL